MALDERFIPITSLNEYFVDKDTGQALAGGTLSFFRDAARNTAKTVFQLTGTPPNYTYTALPNPVPLSSVGTVLNSTGENVIIYLFPFDEDGEVDLYFLICDSAGGAEQFTREGLPNVTAGNDPTDEVFPVSNQIANPQFSRIFLNDGEATDLVVNGAVDDVIEIGPDWIIQLSGTGTVNVERISISGNENVETSPPFVLDIQVSGGITKCFLRQRMKVNSGLWSSTPNQDVFLAGAFIARNENVGNAGLQMFYEESSGGAPVKFVDVSFDNAGYKFLTGTSLLPIPKSTNTQLGKDGFIDIYLSIQANTHIRVSSIQTVPTGSSAGGNLLVYDFQSSNREQALMGDFFIPALEAKPAPSLLIGWDFPLNPSQTGDTGSITGTPAYLWDQTIGARGADNVSFARSTSTGGLEFTTSGVSNAFYILQYLDGGDARKILGTSLSVNVNAWKDTAPDVTMRIYLVRANAATAFPILGNTIGTLSSDGQFTVDDPGWVEIPRGQLSTAKTELTTSSTLELINTNTDYPFVGWEVTSAAQIADTDKFAIVVSFGYANSPSVITIDSVSLIPGDIPCRPGAESVESTLEKCQYYYEKSYDLETVSETVTDVSSLVRTQLGEGASGSTIAAYASTFGLEFKSSKRVSNPTVDLYTPIAPGSSNTVFVQLTNANTTVSSTNSVLTTSWTEQGLGARAVYYEASLVTALTSLLVGAVDHPQAYIQFHYTVDARIGII